MSPTPVSRRSALTLLGLAGLSFPALLECQPRPAAAQPTPDVQQPHMRLALGSLREAKHHLEEAIPDKGGHRVKALGLVNSAIAETEAGIAYSASH